MVLPGATQVCARKEGIRCLERPPGGGPTDKEGCLCDWESGERALGQEVGEVGARKEVQVRDAKPTREGALSLPWLWAAQWGVRGKGTAGGASRGRSGLRPLTPRPRGPTCCLRRGLPGRCGPEARAPPLAGRTAGRARLPTRPSCSGRTGRVACGGGPRARPPGRWTACEARGLAPGRARAA